jgi:hypothetical protein
MILLSTPLFSHWKIPLKQNREVNKIKPKFLKILTQSTLFRSYENGGLKHSGIAMICTSTWRALWFCFKNAGRSLIQYRLQCFYFTSPFLNLCILRLFSYPLT